MRHAKSAWGTPGLRDGDRPLNERGFRSARLMAEHLTSEGLVPGRILCSTALRTRQTLAAIVSASDAPCDITLTPGLYEGEDYPTVILREAENARSLMLIGHNPMTHSAALAFSGSGDALAEINGKYPTAGVAVIDFDGDPEPGGGKLVRFIKPRDLE